MSALLKDLFGKDAAPSPEVEIKIGPAVMEPEVKITMGPAVMEESYKDLGTLPPLHLEVVEQRPSLMPYVFGGLGLLWWMTKR